MKNNKRANYSTGAYGCLRNELMKVIEELDDDNNLYVVSAKTSSDLTIYSFPMSREKVNEVTEDLISAMREKDIFKLGTTWVNTEYIVTIRIVKYLNEEEEDY